MDELATNQPIALAIHTPTLSQTAIEILSLLASKRIHIALICETAVEPPLRGFPPSDHLTQALESWLGEL